MQDDVTEQARDVDVIADGIARFRGMEEPDATDRDEARAIIAALAAAGLVIAPEEPKDSPFGVTPYALVAKINDPDCGELFITGSMVIESGLWRRMLHASTSPAPLSPAADHDMPSGRK